MKNKKLFFRVLTSIFAISFSLTSCGRPARISEEQSSTVTTNETTELPETTALPTTSMPPETTVFPETTATSESAASEETAADSEIKETAFEEEIDFETNTFTDENLSYEIPVSWQEYPEMSQTSVRFFTFTDADLDLMPSNVTVEVIGVTAQEDGFSNFGETTTYESFFGYISIMVLSSKSDLFNIQFSVWEASSRYVYIVEYDRDIDGSIIHQTCYYPMGFNGPVTVYATDFGDDISPDVNEVARHIALTFSID